MQRDFYNFENDKRNVIDKENIVQHLDDRNKDTRRIKIPIRRVPLQINNSSKDNIVASEFLDEGWPSSVTKKLIFYEKLASNSLGISKNPRPKASSTELEECGNSNQKSIENANKLYLERKPCLCKKPVGFSKAIKHVSTQTESVSREVVTSTSTSTNDTSYMSLPSTIRVNHKVTTTCHLLQPVPNDVSSGTTDMTDMIDITKKRSKPIQCLYSPFVSESKSTINNTTCKLVDETHIAFNKLNLLSVKEGFSKSETNLVRSFSSCKSVGNRSRSRSTNRSENFATPYNAKCRTIESVNSSTGKEETKIQNKSTERDKECLKNVELQAAVLYNVAYMSDLIFVEINKEQMAVPLSANFSANVNRSLRKSTIASLIMVAMLNDYSSLVLYQAVHIFDRFINRSLVNPSELMIVGLTALWISLKKNANCNRIPTAMVMVKLLSRTGDEQGTVEKLINYERKILSKLNFNLTISDPFSILTYYLYKCNNEVNQNRSVTEFYYCGGYVINLALLDADFANIPAYILALISAELALYIVAYTESERPCWNICRQKCSEGLEKLLLASRFGNKRLDNLRTSMLQKILKSSNASSTSSIVYEKYKRPRYGGIANFLITKVKKIVAQET